MAVEAAPANRRDEAHARRAADETRRARASKAPAAWRLVDVEIDEPSAELQLSRSIATNCARSGGAKAAICCAPTSPTNDPAQLWQYYIQLVAVEEAFRNLKGDLALRPIYHQDETRIEAHIFVAFLAYCLQITLHASPARPGARADPALRAREVRRRADDRRPSADHRRARDPAHPLHPTRTRTPAPDRPAEAPPAATAAAQDHHAAVNQASRRSEDLST